MASSITVTCVCALCGCVFERAATKYRFFHVKRGMQLYCSRICGSKAKRSKTPVEERTEATRAYMRAYRRSNKERAAAYRQKPAYVAYKKVYDRKYRAHRDYGEYAEAALAFFDITDEIKARATRQALVEANDQANKKSKRSRTICKN